MPLKRKNRSAIQQISRAANSSSTELSRVPRSAHESISQTLARRFASKSFLLNWFRRPSFEVAEAIIRLRQYRGWSQAELARRMKTRQPAIARLESGTANFQSETLVAAAKALRATIRVDIEPEELLGVEAMRPRWWDRPEALALLDAPLAQQDLSTGSVQVLASVNSASNGLELVLAEPNATMTLLDNKLALGA